MDKNLLHKGLGDAEWEDMLQRHLNNTKELLAERGKSYGDFADLVNLQKEYHNHIYGHFNKGDEPSYAFEFATQMIALKLARFHNSIELHEDSIADLFGYIFLLKESVDELTYNRWTFFLQHTCRYNTEYIGVLIDVLKVIDCLPKCNCKSAVVAVTEFVDKHDSYYNLIRGMYNTSDCGFGYITFKVAEELVKYATNPNRCCVVGYTSLLEEYLGFNEFARWSDYLKRAIGESESDKALLYLLKVVGERNEK